MRALNAMTLDEFIKMPYFKPSEERTFRNVIIVPLPQTHESEFSCMKLILLDKDCNVVGVIGGYTDVMMLLSGNPYSWNIDCLNRSKCIRLFTAADCKSTIFTGSSFIVFASKEVV